MLDIVHIDSVRAEEIKSVIETCYEQLHGKELLEIGSGTGIQLKALECICRSAIGIELNSSDYAGNRHSAKIVNYDGSHIPFSDRSFDVLFSSNVLEHIADEQSIHREMHRVLRPNGMAFHVVPTASWRFWTMLTHYPALLRDLSVRLLARKRQNGSAVPSVPTNPHPFVARLLNALVEPRHGEFGTRWTEVLLFKKSAWRKRFEGHGWIVEAIEPLGLVYTGHCLLGRHLHSSSRKKMSRFIGSSSVLFVLRAAHEASN